MKTNYFEAFNKVKTEISSDGMIQQLFKTFSFQSLLTRSNIKKERGYSILSLLYILFLITIENFTSIYSGLEHLSQEKLIDPLLDMMKDEDYDWKGLLYRAGKIFEKKQAPTEKDKMLIFDDSSNKKEGNKVDFISNFYDHAKDAYYKGYQTVMATYYNGFQSIPLSFMFKIGNYRKFNSKNTRRYKKGSKISSIVKYAKKSKTQIVTQMIKQIMKRKFEFSYVLWDSWYTYSASMKFVFNRLVEKGINLVSMVKRDERYYHYKGKFYKYHHLFIKAGRDWESISGSDVKYKEIEVDYLDSSQDKKKELKAKLGKVKLVFVKYPNVEKYRILLSTDLQLSGVEILEKYLCRWSIEMMFKNMKQYFGYNQCMSGKYEVLVADFTIRCIFYTMLSYRREYLKSQSMGEIILEFYKDLYENTLQKLINSVIYNKVTKILNYAIEKGIETVQELKKNLTKVFKELFNRPIEKISPA